MPSGSSRPGDGAVSMDPALAFEGAQQRLGQSGRVMVMGIVRIHDGVQDQPRRRADRGRPTQTDGLRGPVSRDSRIELVVRDDEVHDPRRRVGHERLDMGGEIHGVGLAFLGRDVADERPGRARTS